MKALRQPMCRPKGTVREEMGEEVLGEGEGVGVQRGRQKDT